MESLLTTVIQWHNNSQYEPIVHFLELIIETQNNFMKWHIEENIPATKELATQQTKANLHLYFGNALYRLKHFKRALRAYERALAFCDTTSSRRSSKRSRISASIVGNCDINKFISLNENELKHRIHLCHLRLHQAREAQTILESIPADERSVKVLASLSEIYYQEKNIDKARELYLEILKQDPLRMDIVIKLCKLGGCEASTILDLVPGSIKEFHEWYPIWVEGQCNLHKPEAPGAVNNFVYLQNYFDSCAPTWIGMAEGHYRSGDYRSATRMFHVAYEKDRLNLSGMGSYAACLHREKMKQTLENLAVIMGSKCSVEGEYFHELWLVLAYYYASKDRKDPKALLFVQKAYKLNRYSIEALTLLASLFLEKKDSSKAIPYIVTAHTLAPYRFEVQKILCEVFLANNKKAAAFSFARAAVRSLGESARAYYIWGDIMLKSQDQRRRNSARSCLEKSVKLNPFYLPSVFQLADILMEEKKHEKALKVLESAYYSNENNVELNKYLYTCHSETKNREQALYYQHLATQFSRVYKTVSDTNGRGSQEPTYGDPEDYRESTIGLEADELVEHDSEAEAESVMDN